MLRNSAYWREMFFSRGGRAAYRLDLNREAEEGTTEPLQVDEPEPRPVGQGREEQLHVERLVTHFLSSLKKIHIRLDKYEPPAYAPLRIRVSEYDSSGREEIRQ
jgi:hypothetical protein